jgi:YHS domain-containing protein
MTRHIFIFLGTFLVGALVALGARTATHRPEQTASASATDRGDYAPLVNNAPPADHSAHAPAVAPANAPATAGKIVNTVCAICGMPVDPKLPTLEYQGQTIGFGCKLCAPKFKAEPDKYGPLYLRNEVIKR